MYVKAYYKNGNISMYDCKSYVWQFETDIIQIFSNFPTDVPTQLRKSDGDLQSVWVMNNEGKTIDSYHF